MATYCVVFRRLDVGRVVRFYLKAKSADRAFAAAVEENPELRALGIEPGGGLLFAQNHRTAA